MTTTADVVDALAGVIDAVPGLHVFTYLPDSIAFSGPVAVIIPRTAARVSVNSGMFERMFQVVVGVPHSTDGPAQRLMWTFMDAAGASSVHKLLHDNSTLGLAGVSMRWIGDSGMESLRDVIGVDWWGFTIDLTVTYTTGV